MNKLFKIAVICTLLLLVLGNSQTSAWESSFLLNPKTIKKNWEQNWDQKERRLFYYHIGLQALDTATTIYILKRGAGNVTEMHPLIREIPSVAGFIALKTFGNWLSFSACNDLLDKKEKRKFLLFMSGLCTLAVVNNFSVIVRLEFE